MRQMEPYVKWHFFGQKVIFSVSNVSERFKESISRFPANFKKITESRIFDLSRDQTSHPTSRNTQTGKDILGGNLEI